MKIPLEEIRKANSCLEWHKYCNASCCRAFTLKGIRKPRKYELIAVKLKDMSPDLDWYYRLHNCKVEGDIIQFRAKNFNYKNGVLMVYSDCNYLTEDNKCKGHPDKKPLICQELNQETARQGKFAPTHNCLYFMKE